jgi:lysophospholipase L1-like esterase
MAGDFMASNQRRRRTNGGRLGRAADYAALAVIALASISLAALALSGVSLRSGINSDPTSRPAQTSVSVDTPTPTPTADTAPLVSVSLLGDQNSLAADSWWAQSIANSSVEGVLAASVLGSATPVTVAELQRVIDATDSMAGYVIVQAGSSDITDGVPPSAVAAAVENLWKAVAMRGGIPIVALVPPSDQEGEGAAEVNDTLRAAAAAAGYRVLDLNTPVVAPDGSWAAGFSDDGIIANAQGSRVLAESVATQLPSLLEIATTE